MENNIKKYIWCTYRDWSFKILESIQDIKEWETGLIITTNNCIYDFENFEKLGIPILKIDSEKAKKEFQVGGKAYKKIMEIEPETIISPGWSWFIPKEITNYKPCVTYHPGKLPKDRGGSPIQNQIRNNESWTYVNVMKQTEGLDEGPIYLKKKISLEGYADDVWTRMISAGVLLTREYLQKLGTENFQPTPQSKEEPTIYKRVKPEDAEINPQKQTNEQMYNIIRAHKESDPNTYVTPAYLKIGNKKVIEINNASLEQDLNKEIFLINPKENYGNKIHSIVHKTNNRELILLLKDKNNKPLYLTNVYIKPYI